MLSSFVPDSSCYSLVMFSLPVSVTDLVHIYVPMDEAQTGQSKCIMSPRSPDLTLCISFFFRFPFHPFIHVVDLSLEPAE